MSRRYWQTAALLLVISAGGAAGQTPAPRVPGAAVLQPGDKVKLWIWREKDWSGDFLVNENGIVNFPRLGEWNVLNRTTDALRDSLMAAYKVYLNEPSINVTFLHRINILGAVRQPGVFFVDPTMTIQDALALAGGAEREGNQKEVQLLRDGRKVVARVTQRMRISELPLESGDQIYVPERSWVARNTAPVVGAVVSGFISVLITLSLR